MAYIRSRKHPVARAASSCTLTGAATAAALVALALPAGAQTQAPAAPAAPSATLREIKVEGAADTYKPDIMTSPKYTAPLLDTPQTITVIKKEVLAEQSRQSLVEALSTVPGITFGAGEGGGGYGDSINFRGYSANNSITVDGVRDSAQYNRSDVFNLEQVEVSNGANSVYSGAGNVSGSINLVTKMPTARNFGRLGVGLGTDNYRRVTADVNRVINEGTAIRLNAMAHNNDVPGRDVEKFKRWGVAPSITFGLNSPTKLTLLYQHQRDDNVPQYGVPYYRNAFNNGAVPGASSRGYFGYRDVDTQEIETDSFSAIVDHRFSDGLSLRNLTRFSQVKQFTIVDPPQGGAYCLANGTNVATGAACAPVNTYTVGGPRGNTRDSLNKMITNQTDLTSNFKTGGLEHTLVTGLSLSQETYDLTTGNSLRNPGGATPNPTLPSMSISNPSAIYGGPVNFIPSSTTQGKLNNIAIYAFDNIKLNEKWQVNGGVRYENNSGSSQATTIATPATGGARTPGAEFNNTENLLSYRLGLVYKPVANASVYVAYGNSKTPSQATVNGGCNATNCSVEPEKANNFEIGTKWDVLDNRLSLTASVFRNELENYKVTLNDPVLPAQQLPGGKSRVDGIALGAAGQITPAWGLFANYTYLKSKVLQNASSYCTANPAVAACATALAANGNPLTNTPEHSFGLWTTYKVAADWTLGYGAVYQGSFYLNNGAGPLYKSDSYVTHNLMVAYKASRSLDLQLNIKNLTDELYYTRIRNNGWALPGDGRAVTLSANYAF